MFFKRQWKRSTYNQQKIKRVTKTKYLYKYGSRYAELLHTLAGSSVCATNSSKEFFLFFTTFTSTRRDLTQVFISKINVKSTKITALLLPTLLQLLWSLYKRDLILGICVCLFIGMFDSFRNSQPQRAKARLMLPVYHSRFAHLYLENGKNLQTIFTPGVIFRKLSQQQNVDSYKIGKVLNAILGILGVFLTNRSQLTML